MTVYMRELLRSPHLHTLNVRGDLVSAKRLVDDLCKLDRLPKTNTLEGLLLIQDAWNDCNQRTET